MLETPTLEILIPTVPKRASHLARLVCQLASATTHISSADGTVRVTISSEESERNGGDPVGVRRQRLLEASRSEFVAFVDDDDSISLRYMTDVLHAINNHKLAFGGLLPVAVALWGRLVRVPPDHAAPDPSLFSMSVPYHEHEEFEAFSHSLSRGPRWQTVPASDAWPGKPGKLYLRPPNHLNPVRREIALMAGFTTDLSWGEDRGYSSRVYEAICELAGTDDPAKLAALEAKTPMHALYVYAYRDEEKPGVCPKELKAARSLE